MGAKDEREWRKRREGSKKERDRKGKRERKRDRRGCDAMIIADA